LQAAGWASRKTETGKAFVRETGIITRGVMLNPVLHLGFATPEDAEIAASDHLCLCRNEDLVFPVDVGGHLVRELGSDEFDALPGFETIESDEPGAIPLGVNRYTGEVMRGRLVVVDAHGELET
jgi:hypothetical protein